MLATNYLEKVTPLSFKIYRMPLADRRFALTALFGLVW